MSGFNNSHFLHDKARPHTAVLTQQKLRELGFNVLPHPTYSPDLSPCDYYLFSPFKASLKGQNFNSSNEINTAIEQWFENKAIAFFDKGIKCLPDRWQRCIDANGCYFNRLYNDIE